MKPKRTVLTLAGATMLKVLMPTSAHAQTTTVVTTPVPVSTPVTAEKNVLPNPPMFVSGLTTFAIGYAPALGVAIGSNHKGDDQLFIPVAGPWLDIGKRGCSGVTVPTADGPFEVASGQNCGSSNIETAALIADGTIQGLGILQVVASLIVPEKRVTVVGSSQKKKPSFAVAPTSFAGRGAGAVAAGRF
jgi:hypothetical protein